MPNTYRKVLTLNDFAGCKPTDTDITLVASVWNKLGVYTVPNGMLLAVGAIYDGYIYIRLDTTGAGQIHGKIRIKVSNPTEDLKVPVLEIDTRACVNAYTKQGKPFVQLSPPWAQPNSKLILEFYPEVTAGDNHDGEVIDLDDANTLMFLDCTYRLISEKQG